MDKRTETTDDYDSPWKLALHHYLKWFLAFFFPAIHDDIDWSRGYQALDKEFQQIIRRAKVGKQVADMLFKLWLKDGQECWLFIHVEIQGGYEKDFGRRMFDYNTAVFKLYNREVVSLAVLCDDRAAWRPTTFGYGRWGCWTGITFPVVKLLVYAADLEALEANANPFAVVVLAHLQARATHGEPAQRRLWKFRLVKGLYQRKLSKEDIRELFRLIDWFLDLPEAAQEQFREDVYQYEREKRMPYVTSFERMGFDKGLKKGREEGREEGREIGREEGREIGREEGHEKGLREGLLEGIALVLETKFGQAGRKLLAKAKEVNGLDELRDLARFIKTAKTVDEVRRRLT